MRMAHPLKGLCDRVPNDNHERNLGVFALTAPARPTHNGIERNAIPVERSIIQSISHGDLNMWTKPEVTEMRFGFEVTMYVCNR